MDAADVLQATLEPGERVVWSDRPRSFGRALRRRSTFSLWATLLIASLPDLMIFAVFQLATRVNPPKSAFEDWLTMTSVLGVGAIPGLALIAFNVFLALRSMHRLYAVTDRGRAIVVEGRRFRVLPLPRRALIVTREREAALGDVELDGGALLFQDVSDPERAVETIRAVAS